MRLWWFAVVGKCGSLYIGYQWITPLVVKFLPWVPPVLRWLRHQAPQRRRGLTALRPLLSRVRRPQWQSTDREFGLPTG